MPFTPYHFGPSGFIGLLFRRWIDPVIFVAANIVVDFEVLFHGDKWAHRVWHFHTFLIGAAVGALFGAIIYLIKPLRFSIAQCMNFLHIRYQTSLLKMTIAGSLGACFHVLIDAFYHWDVQPLWPKRQNPLWHAVNDSWAADAATKHNIEIFCLLSFIGVIILVVLAVLQYNKKQTTKGIPDAISKP